MKQLGMGGFGEAYLRNSRVTKVTSDRTEYAVAEILLTKDPKNIVRVFGAKEWEEEKYEVVREYCPFMLHQSEHHFEEWFTLGYGIREYEARMSLKRIKDEDEEVYNFLMSLHFELCGMKIKCHDVKAMNIGVTSYGEFKLVDFGCSDTPAVKICRMF